MKTDDLFQYFEEQLSKYGHKEDKIKAYIDNPKESPQRTEDWFRIRLGRITGSRMPMFMKNGRGGNIWGESAKKVIFQVVAERTMSEKGRDMYIEELMAKEYRQTEWGNRFEPVAKDAIYDSFGYDIDDTGAIVVSDFFSTSPDGFLKDVGEPIEIKCPYDPIKHEVHLSMETEVTEKHEYFWQMTAHIYATNCHREKRGLQPIDRCHFFSFDPRRDKISDRIVHFVCDRNDKAIEQMSEKLEKAEKIIRKRLDIGVYDFDI